jgi:hypothetical protein
MFERMYESGKLKGSSRLNEGIVDELLENAERDCRYRKSARNKAIEKRRYRPR